MKFEILLIVVLEGCLYTSAQNQDLGHGVISLPGMQTGELDIDHLVSEYDLQESLSGPFKIGVTYGETGCPNPLATSYLQIHSEKCGRWNKFFHDRLFIWHDGQTMINMISEEGTGKSICLGDTLRDPSCRYFVQVPAGVATSLTTENSIVLSAVVLGENAYTPAGHSLNSEALKQAYSGTDVMDMILDSEACSGSYHQAE